MPTRACTRCRSNTEPAVLDRATGEAEPLALSVRGMPVLSCAQGHRQFVYPDFPRQLVEHLLEEDEAKLPAGKEKGLLFKHFLCGECGSELSPQPDHRETFPFDVRVGDLGQFKVELTAPVYRCPKCSRQQLHSLKDIRSHTPQALARAFQAADIPPA
jgi:hypothetical protein